MNLITNKQVIFQTHSFAQCINIRNKHHLHRSYANRSYFQKKHIYVGIKIFNCLPFSTTILKNEKAKCKAALRKCQHTHSLYPVNKFFTYKDDLYFCKMCVVLYTVNLYICDFTTCSSSYHFMTQLLIHVCMYVYMYEFMYVCMYARTHAHMHVCMMYVCTHARMYVRTHACMYICICTPATFAFNLYKQQVPFFLCLWYGCCPCQHHSMWSNNTVPGLMLWLHTHIKSEENCFILFTIISLTATHFLHISKSCTK